MIRNERPPHLETVRHQSTSVTLVTREFEADVHVETKDQVADGVVALTLRQVDVRTGGPARQREIGRAHV